MLHQLFKNSGSFAKLCLLICLALFFGIFATLLLNLVLGNSADIIDLKIRQLIISLFALIGAPLLAAYLWYEKPTVAYALHRLPSAKQTALAILLIFCILPFVNLLAFINEQMELPPILSGLESKFREMESAAAELTKQMLQVDTAGALFFNLLVMAAVPAVGEELFCRGALQNIFSEKWGKHVAVWVVAVIFSLVHFQMYGFLPRVVLGALLGYLLIWSGSLWLPILIHFIHNATIVLVSYLGSDSRLFDTLENLGKAETYGYGIASAVVSGLIFWMLKSQQPTAQNENAH